MDRRHALANQLTLPDRSSGTVLFADISGFTPLTAAMAEEEGHQLGIEELTRLINQVYGSLINCVHGYLGSVISFAGDAITCWFDGDDGLQAAACALDMQGAMAEFARFNTPSGKEFSLGIKIAVVAGPVRRFQVGDPGIQQIDVIAGRTLEKVSEGEHLAERGEILLDEAVLSSHPDSFQVSAWRQPSHNGGRYAVLESLSTPVPRQEWPVLPSEALSEDVSRQWMLPEVYARVKSGANLFLAELRPAAALFMYFSGIDYDQDDAAERKLDAFVRWVQSVIKAYDGALLQLTIGDKGSYLYGVFGAPVGHSDDGVRAVNAALALQSIPAEIRYIQGVRIGISYGLMRTGGYGSQDRRTYGVLGDQVNLAARLMQHADAGILCDEALFQVAGPRMIFETLEEIQVKGKDGPIRIYRPTGEKKRFARQRVNLVGRSQERVQLRNGFQALRQGKRLTLLIEGEAGIGKSRLIEEVRLQAAALSIPVYQIAGQSSERDEPFSACARYLQELPGLESLEGLRKLLGEESGLEESLPLLAPYLSFPLPDLEPTTFLKGERRQELLTDLLVLISRKAFAGEPTVLIVEDAQDLDRDTWGLLYDLSFKIPALLMVVATRPLLEPLPKGYTRMQQDHRVEVIPVKPLTAEDSYLLGCEHLEAASLPIGVVKALEKAGGNPFVIEEFLYFLRDEGHLTVIDGLCLVPRDVDLATLQFPTTAQGAVISRIDQLSPAEQLVLKIASVIGREFSLDLLQDIYPVESAKPFLQKHIDTLIRLDLLSPLSAENGYTFQNMLALETAYNSMLFAQRRHLHRQLAEKMEAFGGNGEPNYSILAHHWRNADEPGKAVVYLEKAGQEARLRGKYEEAEGYLRQSLELSSNAGVLNAD
jgi:class 3 adenylate cyclase